MNLRKSYQQKRTGLMYLMTDLKEGRCMLSRFFVFFSFFMVFNSWAGFNENESKQLEEIKSFWIQSTGNNLEKIKEQERKINEIFPEKKIALERMMDSWQEYIKNRCSFENFESLGTDAEIASILMCTSKEQDKFIQYLEEINSMP
ncbi:hypothetical protein [Vibrio cholerae]|uniref:hypothetical protein n=4 Tax=Vibrio cholerae TaxID=666 RepID=UPI00111BD9CE|nr:hypothetical protein [Vibrio cholerae]TXY50125.1 hypothetical protein FXE77_09755 [Vibrio cholerae]